MINLVNKQIKIERKEKYIYINNYIYMLIILKEGNGK